MSSVTSYSNGQLANGTRRAWISSVGFGAYFYDYSTSTDETTYTVIGTLTAKGASASYPAGRVLRENGKKLYPGANPGVNTPMVGVTDITTFVNGFIDPNSSVFALYNTDKASSAIDGVDPSGTGVPDLAPPVYTAGNIETTLGDVIVDTGDISVLAGTITSYGNITTTNGNLSAPLGSLDVSGNITTTNGNVIATTGNISAARQIYSTALVPSVSLSGTTSPVAFAIDSRIASFAQILVPSDIAGNVTVNVTDSAGTPLREYKMHFLIQSDDVSTVTVNLPATYTPSTLTIGSSSRRYFGYSYVSDGTRYWLVGSAGPY